MGWAVFIIWLVIPAAVGSWIGFSVKGRPLTGFLLGIFLGWIGVGILALLPRTAEKKVQKELSERAVHEEAHRRWTGQQGYQAWSGPVDEHPREQAPPPWMDSSTVQADQIAHGQVRPASPEQGPQ